MTNGHGAVLTCIAWQIRAEMLPAKPDFYAKDLRTTLSKRVHACCWDKLECPGDF